MKLTFKQYLQEAPIGDFQTHGNWEKNSSFRDRDRKLIQAKPAVDFIKKKFGNSEYLWNLHFVNSPKANKHTELGKVSLQWVADNLGEDIAKSIDQSANKDDAINIIFTNNKGAEGKNISPWILGHRIGHAFAREQGMRNQHTQYMQLSNHLISQISQILEYYNVKDFAQSERELNNRTQQLTMLYFFFEIATFKSARERNIRDWFEVLNELIAQYITTGQIKFNPAPKCFGNKGGTNRIQKCTQEQDEANEMVQMLARDMGYMIDDMLGSCVNSIYVM